MNGFDEQNDAVNVRRVEGQKKVREMYGTAYIFRTRAAFYRKGQRLITFLGIALPLLVGGAVLSFSSYQSFLPLLLPVIGVAAVTQLILSAWSIVNKWDDAYENSVKSHDRNAELEFEWETLIGASQDEVLASYDRLRWESTQQAQVDEKQSVTAKERRRAMCAALFKFRAPCAVCGIVPRAVKSTNCDCCGNF